MWGTVLNLLVLSFRIKKSLFTKLVELCWRAWSQLISHHLDNWCQIDQWIFWYKSWKIINVKIWDIKIGKKRKVKLWSQILALDYWSIHWKFSIFDTVIRNTSSIQYLFVLSKLFHFFYILSSEMSLHNWTVDTSVYIIRE